MEKEMKVILEFKLVKGETGSSEAPQQELQQAAAEQKYGFVTLWTLDLPSSSFITALDGRTDSEEGCFFFFEEVVKNLFPQRFKQRVLCWKGDSWSARYNTDV